jgi:hypothetical protein
VADKTINDLTATSTLADGDLFEIENASNNSRKITAANARIYMKGGDTAFPGSPATGDKFYRTDRSIEYFYDGTRWLSTNLIPITLGVQDAVTPNTATTTYRATNPFFGVYDFYVERCTLAYHPTSTTAANYFVTQFRSRSAAGTNDLAGTISTQSVTQNAWGAASVTPNEVVSSTDMIFEAAATETGTATVYLVPAIYGRLVG